MMETLMRQLMISPGPDNLLVLCMDKCLSPGRDNLLENEQCNKACEWEDWALFCWRIYHTVPEVILYPVHVGWNMNQ